MSSLENISLAVQPWTDADRELETHAMDEDEEEPATAGLDLFMLYGCDWTADMTALHTVILSGMEEFEHIYLNHKAEVQIAEVCGGEAKASRLAARHHLRHGPNFDLVVGVDLTVRETQLRVLRYFHNTDVLVAVMAPVCTPFGPMSHLNRAINPEAMQLQMQTARPIA